MAPSQRFDLPDELRKIKVAFCLKNLQKMFAFY